MSPSNLLWLSVLAVAFNGTLVHAGEASSPFIVGADISWVQQQEAEGRRWSDEAVEKDLLAILKDHGFNWARFDEGGNTKPEIDVYPELVKHPPAQQPYRFDGKISRPVLENYLARSITMLDLLTEHEALEDRLRMLKSMGAKFAGRAVYVWGHEGRLPERLAAARQNAPKIHAADPEMILQACVFEIVSQEVEKIPVPGRAFEAFGLPPEQRHFRYEAMLYPNGRDRDRWWPGASVPDISQVETKLWFYHLAASYIDAGCEAIHFGQAEIMDAADPEHRHWREVLERVRQYAARNARRHWLLCDAHVPSGGMLCGERLLFDFHSFPLRIVEVPERPQEGVLKMGAFDGIYGRSMGGVAPSGWRCEHLPYLVELDNWGVSHRPGQPHVGGCWVWGYDEISWFAHQDEAYRNQWLRYASSWVREHDPNGFLQMPGSRILHAPVNGRRWYDANTRSKAAPHGFGQEETIKAIWSKP